jgi:DNA-binding NtrC family response regulator
MGEAFDSIITEQDYSVIVTDLMLPRFNGLQLMEQLRASQITIPVIVATAFADKNAAIQAIRFGAFSLIEKPILRDDLLIVVHRAAAISELQKHNEKLVHFCSQLLEQIGDPAAIDSVLRKLKPYIEGLLWHQSDLQKLNAALKKVG